MSEISGNKVVAEHYVTTTNSDLTEGKGRTVDHKRYHTVEEAFEGKEHIGVMGSSGGIDYIFYAFDDEGFLFENRIHLWGYRKDPTGKWGYGWVDNRDAPTDPEYLEYVRLRKKYEK